MQHSTDLRAYASTYVLRRITRNDCLHVDVFAYSLGGDSYAIQYQLRKGGRGAPVLELWFYIDCRSVPAALPVTHPYVLDALLTDPVLMNGKERRSIAAQFTEYHHKYLRDTAVLYPANAHDCRSKSVRFHYFSKPDHDPTQGFANWYRPSVANALQSEPK